jgi:hypothetical protein
MRILIASVVFVALIAVGISNQQAASGSSQPESISVAADEPQESPTPTPTPTPTPDPAIEKANKEKTIAEAEKAAAEARKAASEAETAAIAAKLAAQRAKLGLGPTDAAATATPPAGNITPTQGGKFIETQILADASARQATHQLVEQLCGALPGFPTPSPTPTPIKALVKKPLKTLVINNGADRSSVEKFRSILAQVQFLDEEYKRLIKQAESLRLNLREKAEGPEFAAPLLIPAATEIVKGAATLINLFRTDTEFQDQTVVVNSRTIVTLLTNKLLSASTGQCQVEAIFHPAIYPLSLSANGKDGSLIKAYRELLKDITDGDAEIVLDNQKISALTKRLAELNKEIADLNEKIEAHKKGEKEATKKTQGHKKKKAKEEPPPVDVAQLKNDLEAKEAEKELIEEKITKVKQAVAEIEAFKASLSDIFKLLTAVDDATKLPLLANLIRAERLSDILANPNTYALDLDVKASGTNRIRRNLFWNARIAHSAGVSIDANLYNNEDKQVFGTIEPFYVEFTGSKQIRQQSGFRKLNEIRP